MVLRMGFIFGLAWGFLIVLHTLAQKVNGVQKILKDFGYISAVSGISSYARVFFNQIILLNDELVSHIANGNVKSYEITLYTFSKSQ